MNQWICGAANRSRMGFGVRQIWLFCLFIGCATLNMQFNSYRFRIIMNSSQDACEITYTECLVGGGCSLRTGRLPPPFCPSAVALLQNCFVPSHFQINFKISLSVSTKSPAGKSYQVNRFGENCHLYDVESFNLRVSYVSQVFFDFFHKHFVIF